ncbi:MAG: ATP-binding cassette domain-containing protein [Spirochaetes bacterium]|nr:ATP-binding cassette domain-containing protein [Spirochaetota bacterium]
MSETIFKINEFTTSFGNEVRLYIPELNIEKGKVVVILGNSGCGKTTLFETMGMMKRYSENESKIKVHLNSDFDGMSYEDIWKDQKKLIEIRRKHYSFLFQDSIFFNNLKTVKENILLPKLLQPENLQTEEEEYKKISERLKTVFRRNIGLNNTVNTLSGGEKQRVGFIRACYPDYHVFFADEPTGNLGEKDSFKVFNLIRDGIKSNKNVTALIVTHSLMLAREFADTIIVINASGTVEKRNILKVKAENNEKVICSPQGKVLSNKDIVSIMDTHDDEDTILKKHEIARKASVQSVKKNKIDKYEAFKSSAKDILSSFTTEKQKFVKYLVRPETNEKEFLFRKNNFLLWILLLIYTAAFTGIFYSGKSLDTLEEKMKDPFLLWTDINLKDYRHLNDVQDSLIANSEKFNIKEVDTWARTMLYIVNKGNSTDNISSSYAIGQTIGASSNKLNKLKDDGILYDGRVFCDDNDLGIIVSKEFLKKFNYTEKDQFVYMKIGVDSSKQAVLSGNIHGNVKVPLRVIGYARTLPNKALFLSTRSLLWAIEEKKAATESILKGKNYYLLSEKNLDVSEVETLFESKFLPEESDNDGFVFVANQRPPNEDLFLYTFKGYNNIIDWRDFEEFTKIFKDHFKAAISIRSFPFEVSPHITKDEKRNFEEKFFQGVSIFKSNIDKLGNLSNYMMEGFNEEIDMEYVINLENYNSVSKITSILIRMIVAISIAFSTLFIFQLLYFDLYKSRKYIGYLLAIGASEEQISLVYIRKTTFFLISVIILSFFISMTLYAIYLFYSDSFDLRSFAILLPPANYDPAILVIMSIVFSFAGRRFALEKILLNEPSELIYDRIDNNKEE